MIQARSVLVLLLLNMLLLASCGSFRTERVSGNVVTDDRVASFPTYNGPRQKIQIIKLAISDEIIAQYPELKEKRVGWGLYNRLVDGFFETGRFELLEEKSTLQKKIVEQWELSDSGLAAQTQTIESEGLKVADFLVYAEIFEFSLSKTADAVLVASKENVKTIVGVQIRVVNVRDGSYIPASGTGEASSERAGVWAPEMEFDQSTIGIATQRAVNAALQSVIRRLK